MISDAQPASRESRGAPFNIYRMESQYKTTNGPKTSVLFGVYVREPGNARGKYIGSRPTEEAAKAMAEEYQRTGVFPAKNSRGPRGPQGPRAARSARGPQINVIAANTRWKNSDGEARVSAGFVVYYSTKAGERGTYLGRAATREAAQAIGDEYLLTGKLPEKKPKANASSPRATKSPKPAEPIPKEWMPSARASNTKYRNKDGEVTEYEGWSSFAYKGKERVYLGRYAEEQKALDVAKHFVATGEKPVKVRKKPVFQRRTREAVVVHRTPEITVPRTPAVDLIALLKAAHRRAYAEY